MLVLAAFALLVAHVTVRRAAPIFAATLVGYATWASTRDAGATAVSLTAALIIICWLLDAAARHPGARAITVAGEMAKGALLAGAIAASIAHELHASVVWITVAVAVGAAGVVTSWREVGF